MWKVREKTEPFSNSVRTEEIESTITGFLDTGLVWPFVPDLCPRITWNPIAMARDRPKNPSFCNLCNSPLEHDAVCLACAFERALSSSSDGSETDSASRSGFGDFAPPISADLSGHWKVESAD